MEFEPHAQKQHLTVLLLMLDSIGLCLTPQAGLGVGVTAVGAKMLKNVRNQHFDVFGSRY